MIRALYILTLALMSTIQVLDTPDDNDLISQIIASQGEGDREETKRLVEVLYRRHSGAVYARLAGLAGSSQVDDLAQETWIRILQKLGSYKKGDFRAWALTVANNQFVDRVRKKRPFMLKEDGDVPDQYSDRERDRMAREEWAQTLRECVAKLKPHHREVIVGIVYDELDYKALCAKLGITASQAHKLKHEAKAQLTDCCRRANR